MNTDPISDMFVRIKNAQAVGFPAVELPYSKIKFQIADIFVKEGLIEKIEKKFKKTNKILKLFLKYDGKEPVIQEITRISKPSRRVYAGKLDMLKRSGHGVKIISTSQGIMTVKEAHKKNLGGELICQVW
jgi:small subunit ribosomal protein S8